jgi:hypothetical protein
VTATLAEKITEIDVSLDAASVPHAFGGALALAFHVEEPRATRDIDVNVFGDPGRATEVFGALPDGVVWGAGDIARVDLDGQVRLLWDDTPIDLFFSTHAFHDLAWLELERVPFAGATIPILGATELVVFKAFYDRTRDWADIEAMLEAHTPDVHAALGWLVDLLGPQDARVTRLRDLLHQAPRPEPRFDA